MAYANIYGATSNGKVVEVKGGVSTNVAVNRQTYNKETKSYEKETQWVSVLFMGAAADRARKMLNAGENPVKSLNLRGDLSAKVLKYQDGSEHAALTLFVDSPSGVSYASAGGQGMFQLTMQGRLGKDMKCYDKSAFMSFAETIGYGDTESTQWYDLSSSGSVKTQLESMKVKKGTALDVSVEFDGISIYNGSITIKGAVKNVTFSAVPKKKETTEPSSAISNTAVPPAPTSTPAQPTATAADVEAGMMSFDMSSEAVDDYLESIINAAAMNGMA